MNSVFYSAFNVAAQGMTGIFIFMASLYALILLIDKLFPQKAEPKK
ncbi:MAG: hypothetical protein PHW79_03465 [Candidatus Marinimicrobia bacterium]|jgi:Na+-transporting methylmalonyl-CoA/oxaloacetate decarboxylase gamma subunit|nr:hypothetical protein [Candidatus Neomarinimicrobiota bacterium]